MLEVCYDFTNLKQGCPDIIGVNVPVVLQILNSSCLFFF